MPRDYENDFKGTRQMCAATIPIIEQYLMKYGQDKKEGEKTKLIYAVQTIMRLCETIQNTKGIHYDLYCEIITKTLGPCLKPRVVPVYWTKYLEFVRYFHFLLVDKKLWKETSKIFYYLKEQDDKFQSVGDYKFLLSTFGQHLMALRANLQNNAKETLNEMNSVLESISDLFKEMLQFNQLKGFLYPDLVPDFLQYILVKRTTNVFSYLSQLPSTKNQMFDSFFILLKHHKVSAASKEELYKFAGDLVEAFEAFIHFDIVDKFQTQLSLKHLKACCEQKCVQQDEGMFYMFSLMCYFIKVFYNNAMQKYPEVCNKLQRLLQKSGEALMEEQWFIEALMALQIFYAEVFHRPQPSPFDAFLNELSAEGLVAQYGAFLDIIKLVPHIRQTKLFKTQCCTSPRKHFILSLATSALGAYSQYEINSEKSQKENPFLAGEINKSLFEIIKHTMNVIDSMECCNDNSPTLKNFYGRLLQVTINASTSTQAEFCCKLSEILLPLKNKLNSKSWLSLIRRLHKTSTIIKDPLQQCADEMHNILIASLAAEPIPDMALIKNQISNFYNNQTQTTGIPSTNKEKCLLEIYKDLKHPLKPTLKPNQKRLIYYMEKQHVLKYYKSQVPLMLSLMKMKQSDYDLVLLARACKHSQKAVQSLRDLIESFESKHYNSQNRLDHLIYGHACSTLLSIETDQMKQNFKLETKECRESNLEELFLRKQFENLTIKSEMMLLKWALKSLKGFQYFYEKADTYPISSDEALIDWEPIIDDIATLALFLEMSGYFQHATEAWLLFYRITTNLQDDHNTIRAIVFFCEYPEIFSSQNTINLNEAVNKALQIINHLMPSFSSILKRTQTHSLLCLCQIAYYYAFKGHYSYSNNLLKFVETQRSQLPERKGKIDIVLSMIMAVRFRILWLHSHNGRFAKILPLTKEKNIFFEIENIIDLYPEVTFISSTDSSAYIILIVKLIQQFVECASNRLCDTFLNSFIIAVLKLVIQSGLALRLIQLMIMWMWSNLQMESIDKAQAKLKLIEHIFGIKSLDSNIKCEESEQTECMTKKPQYLEVYSNANEVYGSMESIRKKSHLYLSPIRPSKLQLSPSSRNGDLKRFLTSKNSNLNDPILQWTYFIAGCLNSRLYFLIEDYKELNVFYEQSDKWLEQQKKTEQPHQIFSKYYENMQILAMQHYINYLRATNQNEKALELMGKALKKCSSLEKTVDWSYYYNFALQHQATKWHNVFKREQVQRKLLAKPRRILDFNTSPKESVKEVLTKEKVLMNLMNKPEEVTKFVKNMKPLSLKTSKKGKGRALSNENEITPPSSCPSSNEKSRSLEDVVSPILSPTTSANPVAEKVGASSSSLLSNIISYVDLDSIEDDFNMCQHIQSIDLEESKEEKVPEKPKQRRPVAVLKKTNSVTSLLSKKMSEASSKKSAFQLSSPDQQTNMNDCLEKDLKEVSMESDIITKLETLDINAQALLSSMKTIPTNNICSKKPLSRGLSKSKSNSKENLNKNPSLMIDLTDEPNPNDPKPKISSKLKRSASTNPAAGAKTSSSLTKSSTSKTKSKSNSKEDLNEDEVFEVINSKVNGTLKRSASTTATISVKSSGYKISTRTTTKSKYIQKTEEVKDVIEEDKPTSSSKLKASSSKSEISSSSYSVSSKTSSSKPSSKPSSKTKSSSKENLSNEDCYIVTSKSSAQLTRSTSVKVLASSNLEVPTTTTTRRRAAASTATTSSSSGAGTLRKAISENLENFVASANPDPVNNLQDTKSRVPASSRRRMKN